MAETLAAQLTRVQTAIASLESGTVQSVTIQGRTITYANLKVLYDREQQLLRRTAEASQISRTVAEF